MFTEYQRKPTTVNAVQLTEYNFQEVADYIADSVLVGVEAPPIALHVPSARGYAPAYIGDWIIQRVTEGSVEYYPCPDEVFVEGYELDGASQ